MYRKHLSAMLLQDHVGVQKQSDNYFEDKSHLRNRLLKFTCSLKPV